jgi:hypothetical protein
MLVSFSSPIGAVISEFVVFLLISGIMSSYLIISIRHWRKTRQVLLDIFQGKTDFPLYPLPGRARSFQSFLPLNSAIQKKRWSLQRVFQILQPVVTCIILGISIFQLFVPLEYTPPFVTQLPLFIMIAIWLILYASTYQHGMVRQILPTLRIDEEGIEATYPHKQIYLAWHNIRFFALTDGLNPNQTLRLSQLNKQFMFQRYMLLSDDQQSIFFPLNSFVQQPFLQHSDTKQLETAREHFEAWLIHFVKAKTALTPIKLFAKQKVQSQPT